MKVTYFALGVFIILSFSAAVLNFFIWTMNRVT